MNFNEENLEKLILDGVVEFAGLDEDGEMLYAFAKDLEKKDPEIYRVVQDMHMQDIYYLWEQGYLDMDVTSASPLVKITGLALNQEAVERLPKHLQFFLLQVIEASRIENGD